MRIAILVLCALLTFGTSPPLGYYDYKFEVPELYKLKPTIYHPVREQCDSTPHLTAAGMRIDRRHPDRNRYVALSRDMIRPRSRSDRGSGFSEDAPFEFGDTIVVYGAGKFDGEWVVADCMNKRHTRRIDFLTHSGVKTAGFSGDVSVSIKRRTDIRSDVWRDGVTETW